MNDTTRDELRETIAGIIEDYGYQCINTESGYHESPDEEPIATEIIALVTAARDAEIREALLSASYSYEVADRFNFMHPDKESEEYVEFDRPVTIGTIRAAAEILLDHIGLHGDSDTGGQE